MTQQEAQEFINRALYTTLGDKPVDYSLVTDLVEEKILDSLDSLMFLLALSELSGKEFPEDLDLVEAGLYRVDNLVQYLMAA